MTDVSRADDSQRTRGLGGQGLALPVSPIPPPRDERCCRVSRPVTADDCALDRGGQARINPVPREKEPLYGRDGLRSSRLSGRERKGGPFLPDDYGTGDGCVPGGRECLAHLTEREINQLPVAPADDGVGAA
jgi:hypothetical protein